MVQNNIHMDAYLRLAEEFVQDFFNEECDWSKVPSHLLLIRSVVDSALHSLEQLDELTSTMNRQKNKKLLVEDSDQYDQLHHLLINDIFYIAMHWYLNDEATQN